VHIRRTAARLFDIDLRSIFKRVNVEKPNVLKHRGSVPHRSLDPVVSTRRSTGACPARRSPHGTTELGATHRPPRLIGVALAYENVTNA